MLTRSGKSIMPKKAEGDFIANNKINALPEFVMKPVKDVIEKFCKI
jgi:hypothetical protein